ncbi:MAG: hypothetical protein IPL46_16330 [Saprospiraceae bacterium]|nr:hypothetical protein [Saprospiraceae bacterium]
MEGPVKKDPSAKPPERSFIKNGFPKAIERTKNSNQQSNVSQAINTNKGKAQEIRFV